MLDSFDAIYVINLPERTDRRAEMGIELAKVGLSFDSPKVHLFPAVRPADRGGFESIGARGCFMSHLAVLKLAQGRRNVLILEDDLNIRADRRLAPLPIDWGIFYGGARHEMTPTRSLTDMPASARIECAHFVAFNGAEIGRLVDFLDTILTREPGDPRGGPMHVDGAYNVYRALHTGVRTIVATPELGYQRSSRSDIAPLRWFDRSGIRTMTGSVRKLRRVTVSAMSHRASTTTRPTPRPVDPAAATAGSRPITAADLHRTPTEAP